MHVLPVAGVSIARSREAGSSDRIATGTDPLVRQ
jgi:hypothetical protein